MSELLGTAIAHAAGFDKSPSDSDVGQLMKRLHDVEEQVTDLKLQLAERTDELKAARHANRALMAANNQVS